MSGTREKNGVSQGEMAGDGMESRQVEMETSAKGGHDRAGGRRSRRRGIDARVKRPGTRRFSIRGLTLAVAAREYVWLWDHRHGISTEMIASRAGVSVRRVQFGLSRAQAQEKGDVLNDSTWANVHGIRAPRLIPMFPIGPYTPLSTCCHHRAITSGSLFCCMVCHCSGVDEHPALRRDPSTDPAPEPKPEPPPPKTGPETRKQRRGREFADRRAPADDQRFATKSH